VKKLVSLAALALCWLVLPATAGATAITVTSNADNKADDGLCTLREAVDAANTNVAVNPAGGNDCPAGSGFSEDSIMLSATTYTLTGAAGDDANVSGDLDVQYGGDGVTFFGTWDSNEIPTTTIDAAGVDRIFDIRPDAASVPFFAQGLNLDNGAVAGSEGGGAVRIADPDAHFGLSTSRVNQNDAGGDGGGVFFPNAADGYVFDVSQVQFSQNNAGDEGGGIWIDTPQDSNATVQFSSFVSNTAGVGGGAYVRSAASDGDQPVLQFENSTLTFNSARQGGGAVAFDFGLAGTVFFRFSTVAYNSSDALNGGGGVLTNDADQFVLFQGGTIMAGNAAGGVLSNCAGPGDFASLGYNLDSQDSCGMGETTDVVSTNPHLGMSRINTPGKQTTETMAPFTGSPVLDVIPIGDCGAAFGFDQRLEARPANGLCDIGAFEGSVAPDDAENDGLNDDVDNCPLDQNADQANNDADFQGDACDPDDDNDAVLDAADNCRTQAGPASNNGCPTSTSPPPTGGSASQATTKKCKKKKKKRSAEVAKKKKCKKKKRH
jgi:CSLREA domain-containing protein